jgi:DtxR family Mn-dependent transcriptional regulator
LQVLRAHRLWERYLVDEARMPVTDVHAEAERREHGESTETLDVLDAAMGYPATDPHGDPIPTAGGKLARISAKSVTDWPLNSPGRIVHLEDEPAHIFARIDAEGFRPGQTIWVLEADTRRVVLSDGEKKHVLAPAVAANIFVESAVAAGARFQSRTGGRPGALRLSTLQPGRRATICGLDEALQGFTRRRLLDLGLTPGTDIVAEIASFARDPKAYRVRGSLIALRREQAEHVIVDPDGDHGAR